jgi:4a-hydroxytetrahydrobiopterin dehydratase
MKNLRRLASLSEVKQFKPRPLSQQEESLLATKLKHFRREPKRLHLEYSFVSDKQYDLVIEKMNRIGRLADSMDHHPDWTVAKDKLTINLNTHDIKDISEKDYLLAYISEQILYEEE